MGKRNAWGFPKGHLSEGETHTKCAIRETLEETGILVEPHKFLGQVQTRRKDEIKDVMIWFAEPQDTHVEPTGELDPDNEVADVKWFNIEQLPNIFFYQRKLVNEAVRLLRKDRITHYSKNVQGS